MNVYHRPFAFSLEPAETCMSDFVFVLVTLLGVWLGLLSIAHTLRSLKGSWSHSIKGMIEKSRKEGI
jgi:hypothetical protein